VLQDSYFYEDSAVKEVTNRLQKQGGKAISFYSLHVKEEFIFN
jgi:hypothetical protein